MPRFDTFAMKVNADERRMIKRLAERLQRTQSDAVRLVIREALRALTADNTTTGEAAAPKGELCQNPT